MIYGRVHPGRRRLASLGSWAALGSWTALFALSGCALASGTASRAPAPGTEGTLGMTGASEATGAAANPGAPLLSLAARLEAITHASPLDRVHWGILVVHPRTGDTLYARNPQLPFVPASNMKVPVTHAALARLGPEFRWDTGFWAPAGAFDGEVIRGDLTLRGTGDPTLGPPFHESAEAALDALVETLIAAGVRRVEGRLVVDASSWDSTTVPSAWMVGNLPTRSAAVGGAFAVGSGDLSFEVTGGSAMGEWAQVQISPRGADAFIENRVATSDPAGSGNGVVTGSAIGVAAGVAAGAAAGVAAGAPTSAPRAAYLPERRQWVIEGQIAPGARASFVQSQRDPVRLAAGALAQAFERAAERVGLVVVGGLEDPETPGIPTLIWTRDEASAANDVHLVRVAGLPSPPLIEVAKAILEPSQNWMTEQLVRTLGAELGARGSWNEGFRVMNALFVDELGVDPLELHWRDGSGLSAYNLISPRALVRILDDGFTRPWGPAWRDAMAKPGESGTLRARLTELNGRVFAKTGSISHVNSLSGLLVRDDGETVLFAILTNTGNLPAADVRSAIDNLVREIAR